MPKRKHTVGRPPRGSEFTTRNLVVRLTEEEREALLSHVATTGRTQSDLARTAMEEAGLFTKADPTKVP